jgi:hypothetical protein
MRCCSAGKSWSQIASSLVIATGTWASSSEGSSRTARSVTPAIISGARSTRRSCSSTAAPAPRLATIPDDEERLVLATGRYIGEGFDDARLDTLFLALPVSWKGTLIQYAGRLHRLHPEKAEVRIYDYVDRDVPMLARMFEKRLRGYRAIGYSTEIASAP